ncbi:hypothetical protein HDV05_000184 [Chytridiales sp. JEL 0842]|nr:hypothetical protein HDV05_000184 [Chytridiales sp. JEL 0842]
MADGAPKEVNISLATFYSTLIFNSAVSAGLIIAFFILRPKFPATYAPRAFLVPPKNKSPRLPSNLIQTIRNVFSTPTPTILARAGHDASAALFYMRLLTKLFIFITIFSWIILIPIHITGGNGLKELDALTFGNVQDDRKLWAHLLMTMAISMGTMYVIFNLLSECMRLHQLYLSKPDETRQLAARTLMIRDVPLAMRNPLLLQKLFESISPGSVICVVVPRRVTSILPDLQGERTKWRNKLEGAVSGYLTKLVKGNKGKGVGSSKKSAKGKNKKQENDGVVGTRGLPTAAGRDALRSADDSKDVDFDDLAQAMAGNEHDGGSEFDTSVWTSEGGMGNSEVTLGENVGAGPSSSHQHGHDDISPTSRPESPHRRQPFTKTPSLTILVNDNDEALSPIPVSATFEDPSATHGNLTLPPRPTHRTKYLMGPKVDSITYFASKLRQTESKIQKQHRVLQVIPQPDPSSPSPSHDVVAPSPDLIPAQDPRILMPTAFVIFNDILHPHIAASVPLSSAPAAMAERIPGVDVKDMVWQNSQMGFLEKQLRSMVGVAVVVALVIFWTIIITTVSSFSKFDNLVILFPALKGLLDIPLGGLISGLIPSIVVAVLISLVPVLLRLLATFSGSPLISQTERTVLGQYYFFQVFNILIAVTIAGTLVASLQEILEQPTKAIDLLANKLPTNSSFFITYILLLGLTGPALELLQIAPLITQPIMTKLFGNTPRLAHMFRQPPAWFYATAMATHGFIATVGLVYSVIAPLVSVFVMYIYVHPHQTGGKFLFACANHLFVGLLLLEFLMLGLFALRRTVPLIIIMAIWIGITFWVWSQATRFKTVIDTLPLEAFQDKMPKTPTRPSPHDPSQPNDASSSAPTNVLAALTEKSMYFNLSAVLLPGLETPAKRREDMYTTSQEIASSVEQQEFVAPSHEVLMNLFAHPSASTNPVQVWIPDCPGAEGVMEEIKKGILGDEEEVDVEDGSGRRSRDVGVVVSCVGASVDETGAVRVKASAVAKKAPE